MNTKKFEIPEGLKDYLDTVLGIFEVPHRIDWDDIYLPEDFTNEEFGEVIDDALCEKERVETNSTVPVITYRTMLNEGKLRKIMAYYGQDGGDSDSYAFHLTKREEEELELPDEDTGDWFRRTRGPEISDLGEDICGEDGKYHFTGRFHTSSDLLPYLKKVMERENIQYIEENEECPWGDMVFFRTDIPEEKHHELVVDALCELQRAESGDGLPVYSQKTIEDKEKLTRLMKMNGTEEYNLLSCDHWRQMFDERSEEEMFTEEMRDSYGGSANDFGWGFREFEEDFDGDFATSDEMFPYLKAVLEQNNIEYKLEYKTDINGVTRQFFVTGISEEQHREFVEDAVCEYQRERDHVRVPVYSYKTLINPEKLRRLMEINGTDMYEVLIKDRKRWKQYQENSCPKN